MADYDKYEIEAEKVRETNKIHLAEFADWLKNKGLVKKTIDNHVSNVEFYINHFLLYEDADDVTKGCCYDRLDEFLGDWFIRKTAWASCAHIKGNAASFKKFNAFMLEKGIIKQDDYNEVCETIKEEMPGWLENMQEVEKREANFKW